MEGTQRKPGGRSLEAYAGVLSITIGVELEEAGG